MATVGGNRQEKRKRIMSYFINATIELMEKEGIENLTIRKVAEQAKYNSATLYHYFSNLDELELAYAITIHKSQGSEYPAVVLPLLSGPSILCNRNLLYTAVTRAQKCVAIVGKQSMVEQMIRNETEQKR